MGGGSFLHAYISTYFLGDAERFRDVPRNLIISDSESLVDISGHLFQDKYDRF